MCIDPVYCGGYKAPWGGNTLTIHQYTQCSGPRTPLWITCRRGEERCIYSPGNGGGGVYSIMRIFLERYWFSRRLFISVHSGFLGLAGVTYIDQDVIIRAECHNDAALEQCDVTVTRLSSAGFWEVIALACSGSCVCQD